MDRREVLKNILRGLILIVLGAFTWVGFKNDKIVTTAECGFKNLCTNCNRYSSCNLPKAVKQQQDGRK